MKKIVILLLPLALFAAFLSFKPPAVSADNTPITEQIKTDPTPTTQSPEVSKNDLPNPPVIKGGDDEYDEDKQRGGRKPNHGGRDHKPSYGGHDDDDYDND